MDTIYYAIYGEFNGSKWLAKTQNADPMIFGTRGMAENWVSILKQKWPENTYTVEKVAIRCING